MYFYRYCWLKKGCDPKFQQYFNMDKKTCIREKMTRKVREPKQMPIKAITFNYSFHQKVQELSNFDYHQERSYHQTFIAIFCVPGSIL